MTKRAQKHKHLVKIEKLSREEKKEDFKFLSSIFPPRVSRKPVLASSSKRYKYSYEVEETEEKCVLYLVRTSLEQERKEILCKAKNW